MIKHPEKSDLIKALAENSFDKEISDHIASCNSCKEYMQLISKIIASSENENIAPSHYVEQRILSSYKNINSKHEIHSLFSMFFQNKIKYLKYGAACLIITLFAGIYLYITGDKDIIMPISLKNINGGVYIDKNQASLNSLLVSGSTIKTGENSSVEIYNKDFTIRLQENAAVKFDSAKSKNNESNIYKLNFEKGDVLVQTNMRKHTYHYCFITEHAVIHSTASRFLLKNNDNFTEVVLADGNANLRNIITGKTVTALANKKYTINSVMDSEDIDIAELYSIEAMFDKNDIDENINKYNAISSGMDQSDMSYIEFHDDINEYSEDSDSDTRLNKFDMWMPVGDFK